MATNQHSITGPNILPIVPVPRDWMRNNSIRIATVIGTTAGPSAGASPFNPSTALRTEMAGVIAPSP